MSDQVFSDQNFKEQVLDNKLPVLVDFWAPWCGPCRMVSPIVEELANDYKGKIVVGKLNVDDNPQTAGQYNVMSIPTVMLFKSGQPVKSMVGAQGKDAYKKVIDQSLTS